MFKRLLGSAFRKSRRRTPTEIDAALDDAARHEASGARDAAASLYRDLAEAHPESFRAALQYARFAGDEGDWGLAHALYSRAAALDPASLEAIIGMAGAAYRTSHIGEALAHCETAYAREPRNATVLQHLAAVAYRLGDGERVRTLFAALQALAPTPGRAVAAALMLPTLNGSNAGIDRVRERLSLDLDRLAREPLGIADPAAEVDVTSFYLAYHGRDDRRFQERIAALHLQASPGLAWTAPHCLAPQERASARIRVGLVSRFLYRHSIGRVVQGLVEKLDRRRFALYACSFDAPCDAVSHAIARDAEAWVTLPRTLASARGALASHTFDILLYPDIGMDPLTYFMSFARLAPVQCTTWGHPVTTGVPNVDYFLSTDYFETEGAQAHYSERLIELTDVAFPGYYPRAEIPPPAPAVELDFDRGRRVYYCPQALFKFHPDFDALLAAILRRDAGGEIVITYDIELDLYRLPRLKARLQASGPDVFGRIVFLPRAERRAVYLQRLQACAVVLDTLHYCGGSSSLDAISAGALIVTLPSEFNRGRHTYGFLMKIRFTETIAKSAQHYVELAVAIATDPQLRARLKTEQAERAQALSADGGAVEQIERFFEEAHARAVQR